MSRAHLPGKIKPQHKEGQDLNRTDTLLSREKKKTQASIFG